MNKIALVGALALVSSLAFAGEVKGPPGPDGALGGPTPNANFFAGEGTAASVCSTSGLNDDRTAPIEGTPFLEDVQTQSYGTFLVYFSELFGMTKREVKEYVLPSPGDACNPS
jgi:hypothetical protein